MSSDIMFRYPKNVQNQDGDNRYVILEIVDLVSEGQVNFNSTIDTIKKNLNTAQNFLKRDNSTQEQNEQIPETSKNEEENLDGSGFVKSVERSLDTISSYGNDMFEKTKPENNIKISYAQKSRERHKGQTIFQIALPYPDSFSETQGQKWEQARDFVGQLGNAVEEFNLPLVKNVSKFLGQTSNAMGLRKPVQNPGYFQDYQGPDIRTFSLSWELMPNSVEEAHQITLILYNLKKFFSPQKSKLDQILLQPYHFNIKIMNKIINPLQRLDLMVCTSIQIDYGTKQNIFKDGSPKQYTLKMDFAERSILTQDDY